MTGNVVTGCYLGTDPTATSAVPNTFPGVEIAEGANGNTIGGTTAAARNIISGNAFIGLSIHDSGTNNNLVRANFIGTNRYGHCGDSECLPGHRDFWRRAEQYHRQWIERRWAQRDFW